MLAIPAKRYERNIVNYLNATEVKALLTAPDRGRWHGRRDHTLLLLAIQTGLRVSELIGLQLGDLTLTTGAHVRPRQRPKAPRDDTDARDHRRAPRMAQGTPRRAPRTRCSPPAKDERSAATQSSCWSPNTPPPPPANARRSTTKHVTPHTLRHTNAMLLRAKASTSRRSPSGSATKTSRPPSIYEHADPDLKEQAIARTAPLGAQPGRYRPTDTLLAFLEAL